MHALLAILQRRPPRSGKLFPCRAILRILEIQLKVELQWNRVTTKNASKSIDCDYITIHVTWSIIKLRQKRKTRNKFQTLKNERIKGASKSQACILVNTCLHCLVVISEHVQNGYWHYFVKSRSVQKREFIFQDFKPWFVFAQAFSVRKSSKQTGEAAFAFWTMASVAMVSVTVHHLFVQKLRARKLFLSVY